MRLVDQRLLGRLAQLSWFISNGEVAATRSLGFLLEHQPLRDATLRFLAMKTGVDVSGVQRFVAEAVGVDFIRPDIEGLDVGGKPLLVLEAKFGAVMPQSQVSGYIADQGRRLSRDRQPTQGLLVLLVPDSRQAEARLKAEIAVRDHPVEVRTLVVTWRRLLEVWEHAAIALDEDEGAGLASDVEQLKAMCHTLGGMVIPPLPAPDDAPWRSRQDDFVQVVTQVTSSLAPSNPIGDETGGYKRRRYFDSGYRNADGTPTDSAASVGVHEQFADAGETPVWMRFHKQTPYFAAIRARVVASHYRDVARSDDGHLWIPLTVDPDLPGPDLVADLIEQVRRVQAVVRSGLDESVGGG